jgi:phosphoglycerate dehydrogenase-like enzyme
MNSFDLHMHSCYSNDGEFTPQELIHMDNFILTPHIGSRTVEAESNTVEMATDNLIRLLEEACG